MQKPSIGVSPPQALATRKHLFEALAQLYDVIFVARAEDTTGWHDDLDGAILIGATPHAAREAVAAGISCYSVPSAGAPATVRQGSTIRFSPTSTLPEVLHGRTLPVHEMLELSPLGIEADGELLAVLDTHDFWFRQDTGSGTIDWVASPPAEIGEDEFLCEYFNRHCYVQLLPLLNFLNRFHRGNICQPTVRNACVVFDDPNLHWPTYGCLDFERLAAHAEAVGCHVAIATVPLDAWIVHPRAAEIFRDNPSFLSLVIHGNNHTKLELARWRPEPADRAGILAQALRRIAQLEITHGLQVQRIMEPPHGVFSCDLSEPLVASGYEAVLFTPSQFVKHNRGNGLPASLGMHSTEILPGGLCGIPRIVLSRDWKLDVVLASLLNQSVVIAAHHQDVLDGLDIISDITEFVNGTGGNIKWSSLGELAQASYGQRHHGEHALPQGFDGSIPCLMPQEAPCLAVNHPCPKTGEAMSLHVREERTKRFAQEEPPSRRPDSTLINGHRFLKLTTPPLTGAVHDQLSHWGVWPAIRKTLMEIRDRLYPHVPGMSRLRPPAYRTATAMGGRRVAAIKLEVVPPSAEAIRKIRPPEAASAGISLSLSKHKLSGGLTKSAT